MNYITEMMGKLKASSYPIIIWGGTTAWRKGCIFS